MDEQDLYHQISADERQRMNEAMRRLEAETPKPKQPRPMPPKTATRASSKRIKKRGRKQAKPASPADVDTSAYVTLDAREWLALLGPLPAGLKSHRAMIARNVIREKCQGKTGPVKIWGTVDGFSALSSELLNIRIGGEPVGFEEACRVAAQMTDQVSRTGKWD